MGYTKVGINFSNRNLVSANNMRAEMEVGEDSPWYVDFLNEMLPEWCCKAVFSCRQRLHIRRSIRTLNGHLIRKTFYLIQAIISAAGL